MKPAPASDPALGAVRAAALAAGLAIAQQVAGKAARDALFLSRFEVAALPTMLIAAAVVSIAFAFLSIRAMARLSPARAIPAGFGLSGLLFFGEWAASHELPRIVAVGVYLHVAALGSVLISGFWSVVSERFDPRTARRFIGRIATGGALGGVFGGVLAERFGAAFGIMSTLPLLGVLHLATAICLRRIGGGSASAAWQRPSALGGARTVRHTRYLRGLALLVLLTTVSGTLIDWVMKAAVSAEYAEPEKLLRFFAAFHTGASLVTFVVQASLTRPVLERWGLAAAAATLPAAVATGAGFALALPSLANIAALRGSEVVVKNSLFRSAYELFFTPLSPGEKRGVKSLIDVVFERLADGLGGGLIRLALLAAPAIVTELLLVGAVLLSALAALVAWRLGRGYVGALERSLLDQAFELEKTGWLDKTTATTLMSLRGQRLSSLLYELSLEPPAASSSDPAAVRRADLVSGDPSRVRRALRDATPLPAPLVRDVVLLLDDDQHAGLAVHCLRSVVDNALGELARAFGDQLLSARARRRLARVIGASSDPDAVTALLAGLDDERFEVRFECGRALTRIADRGERIVVASERILAIVMREAAVSRAVWLSQKLPDDEPEEDSTLHSDLLRDRANRSLEHVFTLLSLVLAREPLTIAFQALEAEDVHLRGTALEYLEGVLPEPVRERLWPFLETEAAPRTQRSREALLSDLRRASETLRLKLGRPDP